MDLDLNCSPPSPSPEQDASLLRQQRHQVKDLYWTRNNNLTDVPPPSFWNHSSDALPYAAHHPSHMVDLGATQNPGISRHCDLGKQAHRCHDEVTWENFDVRGSILRKPSPCSVQGRSAHHCLIDLEKPPTLDDDVEIVSSTAFTNYNNHNGGLLDNSQSVPLETSSLMRAELCGAAYGTSGSSDSSDTQDSHSPVRAKNAASGRMCIDLNIAQEDDFNICPEPSKVLRSIGASFAARHTADFSNDSSKTFLKESESSIGSSKGSSITVVTTLSPPYSSQEVMAAGAFRVTTQSHRPPCVEASKYNPLPIRNIHHQHAQHTISGLDSQGFMEIPRKVFSVCSNGESCSSLGLSKLIGQSVIVVHREQHITVISDDEVEGFDLNVSVESIDFPSKVTTCGRSKPVNNDRSEENSSNQHVTQSEVGQNIPPSIECATIRDQQHMAESMGGEDVQDVRSPGCGIATDRCVFIPETPQGRDYASRRLRPSSNGVSIAAEAVSIDEAEVGGDAMAAETLVSIFAASRAWVTDSHGSNIQTDGEDGSHGEAAPSLNSFEESILKLEEMKDDGESIIRVRPADNKDGPLACCGIKLKRGRGLRDFQREVLPGLVSLARHEVSDDLHAIGYEMRKTRSRRRSPGPPTRTRLPRRCSTACNRRNV